MKILITGFGPFEGVAINPTKTLMKEAQLWIPADLLRDGHEIYTAVLPVTYQGCEKELDQLVNKYQPQAIIAMGAHKDRELIFLETTARNLDHSNRPDNNGEIRQEQTILSKGPSLLKGNLPWDKIHLDLKKAGISHELSDHAGSFVCNHLYYWILLNYSQLRNGFIHFPVDFSTREASEKLKRNYQTCMEIVLRRILEKNQKALETLKPSEE